MPNNKGSDDLFRLIHSLTAEEKGYCKKFLTRHTSQGNNYMLLFDTINRQKKFEEQSLKADFKNYAVLKVYLKDMITDCLQLYYRNNHSHIHLFNQLQKAHIYIIKGLHEDAIKILEKQLIQARKMEIFSVERYLLRMLMEQNVYANNKTDLVTSFLEKYREDTTKNANIENNITEFEILSLEWYIRFKQTERYAEPKNIQDVQKDILQQPTHSDRAEMRKLIALNWIELIQNNMVGVYNVSGKRVSLAQHFKTKKDTSFNIVPVLNNHIINCMKLKKYKEAEALCTLMIEMEKKDKLYFDLAFVLGNLNKILSCYETAQFKKGFNRIMQVDEQMLSLHKSKKDETWKSLLRGYIITKIIFLFASGKHKECWAVLQESYKNITEDILMLPNILLLQMMIQVEFENYYMLKDMVKKSVKKIEQQQLGSPTFDILISFFKEVDNVNLKKLAFNVRHDLNKHYKEKNIASSKLFGMIDYIHWFTHLQSGKTLEIVVSESQSASK